MALIITTVTVGAEARIWQIWPEGGGSTPAIQSAVDSAASDAGTYPFGVTIGAFTAKISGCTGTDVQRESWGSIESIYC
jgi:hypothetical protein